MALLIHPANMQRLIFYRKFKWKYAAIKFRQAIRSDSNFALAHMSLGLVLYARNKPRLAINKYLQALRFNPNLPSVPILLKLAQWHTAITTGVITTVTMSVLLTTNLHSHIFIAY